jgi:hypothetical protein
MQTKTTNSLTKVRKVNEDIKDYREIHLRTGFSITYIMKVLRDETRHNELIWAEYAKLQQERRDAQKRNNVEVVIA